MKKDGWRDWLISQVPVGKCESPMELLFLSTFLLLKERLNIPKPPAVVLEEQSVVGPYRADFLFRCAAHSGDTKRLVVEIDGHDFHERTKEQASRDRSRDRWMIDKGIVVIRFTGSEVWNDPFSCVDQTADQVHTLVHGMSRRGAKAAAGLAAINALFERGEA